MMESIKGKAVILGKFAPHELLIEAEDNYEYWRVILRRLTDEEINQWQHKATANDPRVNGCESSPAEAPVIPETTTESCK